MKRYEGMFLFDNTATHQWSEMEAEVRRLCDRIQADLQACVKFDERKLAYEIKGRKRGTYVLTYFDAEPDRIGDLERDATLSELILRTLVLRADKISEERLAELKAWPPEQPLQPISGDGRRGEGGPFRGTHGPATERAATPRKPEAKAEPDLKPATETAPEGGSDVKLESAPVTETEDAAAPGGGNDVKLESAPVTETEDAAAPGAPQREPASE